MINLFKKKQGIFMKHFINTRSLITLCMLFSVILLNACSKQETTKTKRPALAPLRVNTITLSKKAIPIWQQYTGITKASSDQDIRARVPGILTKIYFKDGAYVHKGDKLFEIQQDEYLAALDAAKAKKKQDEASLALATANVKRYKPLVKEGLAPRATLEQYQAKQARLKAAIAGDIAQLNKAKLQLSYTTIRSPINGKVSARHVDIGNLVGQGEATLLTTIVKIDPIYTYFSPSQNDVRLFQKYRNKEKPYAFIEVQGYKQKIRLDGYVDFQDNVVDPLTSTISMRATITNNERKVLPGTFVYINLFINDKYKFLMIPPEVILSDQLGQYVYVVDENSQAKRVNITTDYENKYYVSIKSGLKDGDRVVISSLLKLRPKRALKTIDTTKTNGIDAILKNNNLIPKQR